MKTRPIAAIALVFPLRLQQLQQTRERTLLIQHLQRAFMLAAVEEKKRRDQMQRLGFVFLQPVKRPSTSQLRMRGDAYLQQPVDNLPPNIVRMCDEDIRRKELE